MDTSIITTTPLPGQPTEAFREFWRFASERHRMFERRLRGELPWTTCPVLNSRKFCNTFRILDRTSQYLLRHIIYEPGASQDPIEVTFRTLLFKFFNFIPCWEQLVTGLGALPKWRTFNVNTFGQILDGAKAAGKQIWSDGAYQQASLANTRFHDPRGKHWTYLRCLEACMNGKVTAALQQARTYEQAFHTLREFPLHSGQSGFICMQHLTDLGYADGILHPSFTENDFIWPGPGCCMGVEKAQGLTRRATTQEIQAWLWHCWSKQDKAFAAFGLVPPLLNGRRPPSLMDLQNCACETNKLTSETCPEIVSPSQTAKGKDKKPNRIYQSMNAQPLVPPIYPPKWAI